MIVAQMLTLATTLWCEDQPLDTRGWLNPNLMAMMEQGADGHSFRHQPLIIYIVGTPSRGGYFTKTPQHFIFLDG